MDGSTEDIIASRMNVAERMANLMALGKPQKVNNAVPIVRYYRSMIEVHRMALSYLKNQDMERALILLIRFCSFVIEELTKHTQFATFDGPEKKSVMALLKPALDRAEGLKKHLRAKFEVEAEEARKLYARQAELMEARRSQNNHVEDKPATIPAGRIAVDSVDIVDPGVTTNSISFPGISVLPGHPNNSYSSPTNSVTPSAPPIDRASKPGVAVYPTKEEHSPIGIRTVLIAGDLIQKFLICADNNTARNIETCGTLCGSIVGRDFLVSHVILPKQTGASDGCSAEGEEEVFAYQNEHDLITLGWIHTHPSQTAFLSSVDLHTHCAYQMMLSEAVAIVCAPSHDQVGTFVMTSYGMSVVESCTQTGFHLHPEAEKLFIEAEHVKYSSSHTTTIVDLRK
ncbi:hypothetical protein Q1695_005110 [Nippostrongylus brasiliensis]|nr:hypothetical protein Q1695_005110 [Nippostrongylus brasiliensis]